MPRLLLRDGRIALDEWRYLGESADELGGAPLILPAQSWLAERDRWLAHEGALGVLLSAAHAADILEEDLPRFALIGAEFSGPGEGRGYTQGRVLRERFGFAGELRATGYVRRDQVFYLARCGFNSFEMPPSEFESAAELLRTFSAAYQPSNDAGLPAPLARRAG